MGSNNVFERIEKKYRLNQKQYEQFLAGAKEQMHADEYGLHTIRNIYYDTEDYGLIRNSLEKPKYKEKFRLRGYGEITSDSRVFLEIKKKYKGIVYKRRTSLLFSEASRYLKEGILPEKSDQIMKEIDYFMKFYNPVPKVYLAYDRVAYVGNEDSEIRITIDRNIRSRHDNLDLGCDEGCRKLNQGSYLMEIKVPASYPLWLVHLLTELQIYPVSFSKYGNVYADAVKSGEIKPGREVLETNKKEQERSGEKELCLQVYSAV